MAKSNTPRNDSQNNHPKGAFFPEPLRKRLSEDLHLTGKAKRTHDGYIRAIRQLSDFAKCSPDKVTEQHVRQFFLHLKLEEVKWLVWLFLGWTYWLASGHAPQAEPLTAPLRCSECGGTMQVIEVTYESLDMSRGPPGIYIDSG